MAYRLAEFESSCLTAQRGQLPRQLNSFGDWIRKTRLDRGLFQIQVAERLGIDEDTIVNWELGRTKPEVKYIPRIIEFVGYYPYVPTTDLCQRLKAVRRAFGLTQEQLARALHLDESSINSWERGEHQPVKQSQEVIHAFLANPEHWAEKAKVL